MTVESPRSAGGLSRTGAVAIGLTGGAVGGLFGGSSGVFYVPLLDRFSRLPRPVIHGTSTVANAAVCGVGAAVYAIAGGAIDLHSGTGLIVGGFVGGLFGAGLISKVPDKVLRLLFLAILLLTALKLILDSAGSDPLQGGALVSADLIANLWFTIPVSVVAGLVVGAWAGALGLGGGLLAVPVLALLFGVDLHTAEGTSLLIFLPNSISGGYAHIRRGTASPRVGGLLSIGAAPGAVVGALLSLALDSVVLGTVFAAFCLAIAAREIIQLWKRWGVREDHHAPEPAEQSPAAASGTDAAGTGPDGAGAAEAGAAGTGSTGAGHTEVESTGTEHAGVESAGVESAGGAGRPGGR